jgi:hypothetical protein
MKYLSTRAAVVGTSLGSLALAVGILGSAAPAKAIAIACPINLNDNLSGSPACQYSTTANNDFLNTNPITVNAEQFFGFNDWKFGGKIGENTGYNGVGTGQSGTWNITSVAQANWINAMLIFKDGNDTTLVGYLTNTLLSGNWSSPFENPPFNVRNTRNVSHISVYYREGQPIPTPALLPGLVGLGLAAARRKKSALASGTKA